MLRTKRRLTACMSAWFLVALVNGTRAGEIANWKPPEITAPRITRHPALACSSEELARLQQAYHGSGPAHRKIVELIGSADRGRPSLSVSIRGGQHNQWYQCDTCQIALKTIDPEHHRCPSCQEDLHRRTLRRCNLSRVHNGNLQNMVATAWAYAVTGDAQIREFAGKLLLGYANRYAEYPYHAANLSKDPQRIRSGGHLFEQTLNEASVFLPHDRPGLRFDLRLGRHQSQADHERIRNGLLIPLLRKHRSQSGGEEQLADLAQRSLPVGWRSAG